VSIDEAAHELLESRRLVLHLKLPGANDLVGGLERYGVVDNAALAFPSDVDELRVPLHLKLRLVNVLTRQHTGRATECP
jgi:hypothetical protein